LVTKAIFRAVMGLVARDLALEAPGASRGPNTLVEMASADNR